MLLTLFVGQYEDVVVNHVHPGYCNTSMTGNKVINRTNSSHECRCSISKFTILIDTSNPYYNCITVFHSAH